MISKIPENNLFIVEEIRSLFLSLSLDQALDIRLMTLGSDHQSTPRKYNDITNLPKLSHYDESTEMYSAGQSEDLWELPPSDGRCVSQHCNYQIEYQEKYEKAEVMCQCALDILSVALVHAHPTTLSTKSLLDNIQAMNR